MSEVTRSEDSGDNSKQTSMRRYPAFGGLWDEMDRWWQTAMANPWRPFRGQSMFPAIDVFQKDGKFQVHAELPGMTQDDIDIRVEGETMTISGEKTQTQNVEDKDFHRSERSYGRFSRQVTLPPGADTDNITAEFKNGVLQIEVPIDQAHQAKRINIRAA
jgi:HSP20 family protein